LESRCFTFTSRSDTGMSEIREILRTSILLEIALDKGIY
jgi:hypothetical protein